MAVISVIWTVALVFVFVLALMLYKKIALLQNQIQKTIEENRELFKPAAQVSAVLEAVRGAIDIISRVSKIGKGGE